MRLKRLGVVGLLVVLVLIGLYAAVGFLVLPRIARGQMVAFVRDHYQRRLEIGDIRFNPFTLTLDVTQVHLPDADSQVLFSFTHLRADLRFASAWRRAVVLHSVLLEQPTIRAVVRPSGELNLADLGKGFPKSPPSEQPGRPVPVNIELLAITGGSALFEDRTRPGPFRADFQPVDLELHDFSTAAGQDGTYVLSAASPQGERLDWRGTVELNPVKSRGEFSVQNISTRTVWNYLRKELPFEIDSGVLGVRGSYALALGNAVPDVNVDLNTVNVAHLGIKPLAASSNYVEVDRLDVSATRLNTKDRTVSIGKVLVTGGLLRGWMDEKGSLNLLELTPGADAHKAQAVAAAAPAQTKPRSSGRVRAKPPAAPSAAPADANSWRVAAPDLQVNGLKVEFEDRQVRPALAVTLSPLNITVRGFTGANDAALDLTLDSGINNTGKLVASGRLALASMAANGHLQASGIALPWLQPYVARSTSMTILKGDLSTSLDVVRAADAGIDVRGSVDMENVHTVDNQLRQDFIKWKSVRVAQIQYRSSPVSLRIGSVAVAQPYVRMIVAPDRTTNISAVLRAPGQAAVAPTAIMTTPVGPTSQHIGGHSSKKLLSSVPTVPAQAQQPVTPFPVTVGSVRLQEGSANYTDLWIKPSFAIGIQSLNGTITGLSSDPKSRAQIQLTGKVARYSPLTISGSANLLSAALFTDINLAFKDLDLPVVNPYSGYFAGYRIDKGKLSVDVHYQVEQRQLKAAQHFVIDQLELGEHVNSPEATHLPLKLAVSLLKDRHGVIDLDLPMNGSLDDPKFRIAPVVWKILGNLIAKAVTAPFALLGHLFGGGEHPNLVSFAPGSAVLDKSAQDQLTALARSLEDRPGLKLDIPIVASESLDGPVLVAAQLHAALLARVTSGRHGANDAEASAALPADPKALYGLLIQEFRAQLPESTLPANALAVETAKRKQIPPYAAANDELRSELLAHLKARDADLDALGKARAKAIQDVLLGGGAIDPGRVFIVNNAGKPQSGDKVVVELALK